MVCEACNGDGIVGAGDFPKAKQGPLKTCSVCGGTGKVVDGEVTASDEVVTEPEVEVEEKKTSSEESSEVGE